MELACAVPPRRRPHPLPFSRSIAGGFATGYDDVYAYDRDGLDARHLSQYGWSGSHGYEPDYNDCHDHDFDMDFGGDFGF